MVEAEDAKKKGRWGMMKVEEMKKERRKMGGG